MNTSNADQSKRTLDEVAFENAKKSVGFTGKARRAIQIFQHYQLSQIARRGIRVVLRRLQPGKCIGNLASGNARLKQSDEVTELADCVVRHHADHPSHSQCDIDRGIFVLLNHRVDAKNSRPSPDVLRGETHLWRFQFHYHEFLLTQAANGSWEQIANFLNGWLEDYSPSETKRSDDSWHPYCISRRAVVWIWLLVNAHGNENRLSEKLTRKLIQSLEHQAQYLSQNIERELGGNHLIENATALAIVGGVIESDYSSGWQKIANDVLANELPKQVLDHGEHFEYSPMYHCQILSNMLRIEICNSDLRATVDPVIEPMLSFLSGILHPDDEIPLFADSVFHEAPSIQQISSVAVLAGRKFAGTFIEPEKNRFGDYFLTMDNGTFAICDFGPIAAPTLPAHGHCDVFNLEVSVGKNRWFVDSGNFNYSDDSMRHYCRSSIGHNVVTVDDENQANVWSMFRMGRRPKVSGFHNGSDQGWNWASASHNGYAGQGVGKLGRIVAARTGSLLCVDVATLQPNAKCERLVGYLHLHPDLDVGTLRAVGEFCSLLELNFAEEKRWLYVFADSVTLEKGWYCDEFGKRREGSVVRYLTTLPSRFTAWVLQESPNQCEIEYRDQKIGITMGNSEKFCWNPFE